METKRLVTVVACIITITGCIVVDTYCILQMRNLDVMVGDVQQETESTTSYVDTDGDYNTYDVTIDGTEYHLSADSETMDKIINTQEDTEIYDPRYEGCLTTVVDGIYDMSDEDILFKVKELVGVGELYLNTADITGSDTDDKFALQDDGYLYESNSMYKHFRFSIVDKNYPDTVFVEEVYIFTDDTVYCTMSRG